MNNFGMLLAAAARDLSRFENLDRAETFSIGAQVALTGILIVFVVLILIWGALALFKVFMYDIPNRKKSEQEKSDTDDKQPEAVDESVPDIELGNDEEIAAITAAIAVVMEEQNVSSGFRVVSFKRK